MLHETSYPNEINEALISLFQEVRIQTNSIIGDPIRSDTIAKVNSILHVLLFKWKEYHGVIELNKNYQIRASANTQTGTMILTPNHDLRELILAGGLNLESF